MRWTPLRRRVALIRNGLGFNARFEPLQRVAATVEETVVKIAPLARPRLRGVVRQRSGSRNAHPALAIALLKAVQGHPARAHASAVRSPAEPRLRRKQKIPRPAAGPAAQRIEGECIRTRRLQRETEASHAAMAILC